MSLFGILTKAAKGAASTSRAARSVAGKQVRQGKTGFVPSLLGTAGRKAKKQFTKR